MNNKKKEHDNSTIGLLLCQDKDRLTVEYSLKSMNVLIGVSSFEIEKYIPNVFHFTMIKPKNEE